MAVDAAWNQPVGFVFLPLLKGLNHKLVVSRKETIKKTWWGPSQRIQDCVDGEGERWPVVNAVSGRVQLRTEQIRTPAVRGQPILRGAYDDRPYRETPHGKNSSNLREVRSVVPKQFITVFQDEPFELRPVNELDQASPGVGTSPWTRLRV